jgi:hypothetical protein
VAAGKERGRGVGPGKAARCGAVRETATQGGHAGGRYGEETEKREGDTEAGSEGGAGVPW